MTSFDTALAVRRLRKMTRSRIKPIAGARMNTDRISAGTIGQSQSSRALKYIAAEM